MMRYINMIQHLLLLLPLFSCATAADPRLVFAHYMLYAPDSVETLQKEIQLAYSKGIDAFALNTNVWRPELADNMYQAAQAVGSDFKLFFSADMHSDSSGSLSADDIVAMMTRYKDHPNQLTYQGKQFFSSWLGYQYDWQSVFNKAGGKANYFFVPLFPTSGDLGDVNDKLTQSNDIIDGLMAWDTSAWPYYDSALQTPSGDKDSNYLQACNEKGKVYMATPSPWFFKNIQSDSCCSSACMNSDENNCNCQVKGNYQGPGLWLTRWQQIISLNPPLVEIVTWNDWLESSYVAPPLSQGDNAKSVASFTHQAYLDLGEHYIRWYKTGSEPAVTEDALYLFYYTQSKNAVATTDSCKVLHSGELSDKVYVTTVLRDAATVVLNSGSASQTFNAPAGINTYSTDFSEGQQSATVSRGGSVVKSVSGGIQISNSDISRFNFNVYSSSAGSDNEDFSLFTNKVGCPCNGCKVRRIRTCTK